MVESIHQPEALLTTGFDEHRKCLIFSGFPRSNGSDGEGLQDLQVNISKVGLVLLSAIFSLPLTASPAQPDPAREKGLTGGPR